VKFATGSPDEATRTTEIDHAGPAMERLVSGKAVRHRHAVFEIPFDHDDRVCKSSWETWQVGLKINREPAERRRSPRLNVASSQPSRSGHAAVFDE